MYLRMLLIICLCVVSYGQTVKPCFFWDFSSDTPNIFKTDGTPDFSKTSRLVDGTFFNDSIYSLVMFNNPTLEDEWCPTSEGSVELYWQYVEPWDGKMLFQITGKDITKNEDTNEAWVLAMRGRNPGEFTCTWAWEDSLYNIAELRNRGKPITLVNGKWYRFRLRYKVGVGISMQIDDGEVFTMKTPLGKTRCTAWHHLLIGNDTQATGVQFIDDFSVWPVWLESFPKIVRKSFSDVKFKNVPQKKGFSIINQPSKGFYSLDGRFIGQGAKRRATILQVETFQNMAAKKVFNE